MSEFYQALERLKQEGQEKRLAKLKKGIDPRVMQDAQRFLDQASYYLNQ